MKPAGIDDNWKARICFSKKIGNPFTDVYSNLFEVKVSKVSQIDLVAEERNGSRPYFSFFDNHITNETSMPTVRPNEKQKHREHTAM